MKRYTKSQAGKEGGKIGGKSKSRKKTAASVANGAKGGRPRKVTISDNPKHFPALRRRRAKQTR